MSFIVKHRSFDFMFPASEPPSWAGEVERWYQLDAFAFGLPQAASYWGLSAQLKNSAMPTRLVLASPEGSNRTDFDFARSFMKTGTGSPSKFVHTLPNSRSAALLQVLGWFGPLLCLQNDPSSIGEALMGAIDLLKATSANEAAGASVVNEVRRAGVWVFAVTRKDDSHFTTHLFEVNAIGAHTNLDLHGASTFFIQSSATAQRVTHGSQPGSATGAGHGMAQLLDQELIQWLQNASASAPALALNLKFQISLKYISDSISESQTRSDFDSKRTRT